MYLKVSLTPQSKMSLTDLFTHKTRHLNSTEMKVTKTTSMNLSTVQTVTMVWFEILNSELDVKTCCSTVVLL